MTRTGTSVWRHPEGQPFASAQGERYGCEDLVADVPGTVSPDNNAFEFTTVVVRGAGNVLTAPSGETLDHARGVESANLPEHLNDRAIGGRDGGDVAGPSACASGVSSFSPVEMAAPGRAGRLRRP